MKLKVAIFGGSGYGGAELLRLLFMHPQAEIGLVKANEHAGKAVGEVHKNLYGLTELRFTTAPEDLESLKDLDFVFLSFPHGQAIDIVPRLPKGLKVIDLSGDFRLSDREVLERYYQREPTAMQAPAG